MRSRALVVVAVAATLFVAARSAPASVIVTKTERFIEADTAVGTDDPAQHAHQELFEFEPNLPIGSWSKTVAPFSSALSGSGSSAGSASSFASQTSTVFVSPAGATFSTTGTVTASFTAAGPATATWTDPIDNHYFTIAYSSLSTDFTLDAPTAYHYLMSTVFVPGAAATLWNMDTSATLFDIAGDQDVTGTLPAGHYRIFITSARPHADNTSSTYTGNYNGSFQLAALPVPEPATLVCLLPATVLAFGRRHRA